MFRLLFLSRSALLAENLFLRKQLALFVERKSVRHRTTLSLRLWLVMLSRWFEWREALVIVKPDTLVRWHKTALQSMWRWKARRLGRPPIPEELRALIRRMGRENRFWSDERIANELALKLGIRVSPRTVAKYRALDGPARGRREQNWATFVRNHAKAMVACDFFTVMTARMQVLCVFVAMEVGSRRILHTNVTPHPTAEWTIQQFREFLAYETPYRYVIHDRDQIFSEAVDGAVEACGVKVLKTPVRAPMANAYCERLIGTLRRECVDFVIPMGEQHLRRVVGEFAGHYNRGRPHMALGPGTPEPMGVAPSGSDRHRLAEGYRVTSRAVLGGLHHEYGLVEDAA